MTHSRSAALLLLLGAIVGAVEAEECTMPLPAYQIAAPVAGVPEAYADFLGVWGNGKWDGYLCNRLVVRSIDAEGNASVIYSWGTHAGWSIMEPGYLETSAMVDDGVLVLNTFRNGATANYRPEGAQLKGEYVNRRNQRYFVTLERISWP